MGGLGIPGALCAPGAGGAAGAPGAPPWASETLNPQFGHSVIAKASAAG